MSVKFLVVDDEKDAREIMSVMLGSLGCEFELAASGAEALEIVNSPTRAKEFSAIFLDVMMNPMNGYEVMQKLKDQPHTADIPIIMLTSFDKSAGYVEAFQKGANYYITKPFTREQVVYGLDMVLGNPDEDGEAKKKSHNIPEDW